ncbi:tetratricopeptide repeat-containing sulfotransferase family protein [Sphingosinicella terrae]|uniref:tetratricopeptide repeat-containing sulfotransferase family protein n=1 Tax=Sphingosinicella terrae TaxID=2172047 RepID=UPI000E0D6868|nr:tetratricopeptide repeat-containing sulfotransferase family protein [Sphingosinicella terrae]
MEASTETGSLLQALSHAEALLARQPALAEEQAREILRVFPRSAEGLTLCGRALAAQGRLEEAIAMLRRAAAVAPDSAEAWRELGNQLFLVGDHAGADQAYAQQIRCSVGDPRLIEAAVALCDNDLPVAERLLKTHLKAKPTDVAAIRMLAELAGRLGRYRDARMLLGRALELAPSFAPARFNLATILYRENRTAEALAELDRLMADDPDNPAYRNLAGAALTRIGELDDAIVQFEHVLRQRPGQARIWMSYGHALKTVGRQADSVAAYRRCIALAPGFGEAWWSLANLKTVRLAWSDLQAMEAALARDGLSVEDRFHLHFALGKANEDLGEAEAAFDHYAEGNRLRRSVLPYDPAETSARVDCAIHLFTPSFFARRQGQGCVAGDPIFVLGMPRAGSTLVEQILASHSDIEGTQELPDIQHLARRLAGDGEGSYPEILADLPPDRLRALGEEYLERTRIQRKTDRPHFIDKMPNNWAHVGLIHLILPDAKVVDVRRHPLACCVSNFRQHFARGQAFSYDLADLGRYYADYARLMAHFDDVLPGRIHRIFYEALVADIEGEVRRLLDHLGLAFDPACLRFHETVRPVRTASSEQVRRPISRAGIDQWKLFEDRLGPLREALGPALRDYPFAG